jgi:hypothetical protein
MRDRRDWKRSIEGQRHGDAGTTTIALDVRETEETGRGTATWRRGDNYNCFGCKRDRRNWKRRKRNSDMETRGQLL